MSTDSDIELAVDELIAEIPGYTGGSDHFDYDFDAVVTEYRAWLNQPEQQAVIAEALRGMEDNPEGRTAVLDAVSREKLDELLRKHRHDRRDSR